MRLVKSMTALLIRITEIFCLLEPLTIKEYFNEFDKITLTHTVAGPDKEFDYPVTAAVPDICAHKDACVPFTAVVVQQ